jgi:hypothetical protein
MQRLEDDDYRRSNREYTSALHAIPVPAGGRDSSHSTNAGVKTP